MITNNNLRNAHGHNIGRLDVYDNGDQRLFNEHGSYLGMYQSIPKITVNEHGNPIGSGNLLMTLLRI